MHFRLAFYCCWTVNIFFSLIVVIFSLLHSTHCPWRVYCISIGHMKLCIAFIYRLYKFISMRFDTLFVLFRAISFSLARSPLAMYDTLTGREYILEKDHLNDDLFITWMIEELFFCY